jgi:hypothetical protein
VQHQCKINNILFLYFYKKKRDPLPKIQQSQNSLYHKNMFIIKSPLSQFEVTNLIGVFAPIFGQLNIILTNLALYTLLIIIIVIGLHYFGNNDSKIIPNN